MDKISFKSLSPYLIAMVVFLAITFVYFYPVLEGKKLKQHDIKQFKGMSKELADFREDTNEEALWTNSMFSGMPAWQISVQYKANLMRYVDKIVTLNLPYPANYVFLYFLGFFILLLILRLNPWISMLGAIAFALSSYFFIILGAGHTSKAHAIGYMAPVLAGIILSFRGKYLRGGVLTAIALSLEILSGHLQITYYLLFIVLIYGIYQITELIKTKDYLHFSKASGVLIIAALLAICTHSTNLWATYDYGKDTMRGKPELTKESGIKSSGLDKDYITAWSYGVAETWSFLIPNAKGGASGLIGNIDELKHADPNYRQAIARQGSSYWGDQPGTSGPVYVGVIVMFLFILGLFIVRSRFKWALLAATILSVMLAWGKNFMPFTDIFIDYVPAYAKFRAVSMILVIAELTIPILAFITLNKIFTEPQIIKKQIKYFYIAFGATAGTLFIFYLSPSLFLSFLNQNEIYQFGQMAKGQDAAQITAFMNSLQDVRIAIFKADVLRSLFFIIAAAAILYFYIKGKLNKTVFVGVLALLIVVDMVGVNKRYLNNNKKGSSYTMWESKRSAQIPFTPSKANKFILQDKNPNFRVLDLSVSTFNDASTSYFHKSIGGYHGAKLQRYQDLIEHNIDPEMKAIINGLSSGNTYEAIKQVLSKQQILNMLNTNYIIYNPDAAPLFNENAFGNAWVVNNHKVVANADEEIAALKTTDLKTTAIIDKRFEGKFSSNNKFDNAAKIILTSYAPNKLEYNFNSTNEQMVVFSEIYYPKGWNAYVDGEKTDYFRANYVLRAMMIPAGNHKVEFRFEPKIWAVGEMISLASSSILILLLLALVIIEIKSKKKIKQKA
jgi:hypothetical protein